MQQQAKILLYGRDRRVIGWFEQTLANTTYTLVCVVPEESTATAVGLHQPDLVLLDDLDCCRAIRQRWRSLPILYYSLRGETQQIVQALDQGADDFITVPFPREECAARIRALLRRPALARSKSAGAAWPAQPPDIVLRSADGYIVLHTATHCVLAGQQEIHLTNIEFELLQCLLLHAGRILSHRMLLRTIWGPAYGEESDYVRIYIRRLRQKIEIDPARPRYIRAKIGEGYGFLLGEANVGNTVREPLGAV